MPTLFAATAPLAASFTPRLRSPAALPPPTRWLQDASPALAATSAPIATDVPPNTEEELADIEFPQPLTFRESVSRALTFWVKIAPVAAKVSALLRSMCAKIYI